MTHQNWKCPECGSEDREERTRIMSTPGYGVVLTTIKTRICCAKCKADAPAPKEITT